MFYDEVDEEFEYTKEFRVSSSLIDSVYFNENDGTVVLDVDDTLYRYSGVNGFDVSALVRGDSDGSVGAYYNTTFKPKFGPAEKLGYYGDFDPVLVVVTKDENVTITPKNLTVEPINGTGLVVTPNSVVTSVTKEYSLNSEPVNQAAPATKEYSLSFEEEAPTAEAASGIDGVTEIVVHFTIEGMEGKKFKFAAENSTSVEDALEELNDYVSRVGMRGRVRKVVVKFE